MAKQKKQIQSQRKTQNDDALFEALGRSKKRKKRKVLITVISIVAAVAVVLFAGVSILQQQVRSQFGSQAEVLAATVTTGTISTTVSGSGSLTDTDMLTVTVPSGVEITEILVQRNDSVSEGDVLAMVDMSSVTSAMASLQTQIESLDKQIAQAETDYVDESILAGVSGTVKYIFADNGSKVLDTMYEYGSLALIALDEYMSVDIQTRLLERGDKVRVWLADSTKVDGTVESVRDGIATVVFPGEGVNYNDTVTVYNDIGDKISSGQAYLHNALRVSGYAGTVSQIHVSAGDTVTADTLLFTLEETSYSANYETLLRSRREKEETLLELMAIQKDGAILASSSGSIYSVDHTDGSASVVTISKDESMTVTISVDESNILSLELGQEVDVYVTSVSEEAFAGTLTEINRTSSSSGTYSAVITLDKEDGMLSGMTASVSVRIEGVENALLIPVDALQQTSTSTYVYTTYDESTQQYGGKVEVEIGLQNSSYVEIVSGLSEGDTVYYTEKSSVNNMFGGMGDFGGMGGMGSGGGEMPDISGSAGS